MLHANRDRRAGPGELPAAESRPEAAGGRHGLAQGIRAGLTKGKPTVEARATRTELRNFGLIVGGIFGALSIWPWVIRGGNLRQWMLGLPGVIVLTVLGALVVRTQGRAVGPFIYTLL